MCLLAGSQRTRQLTKSSYSSHHTVNTMLRNLSVRGRRCLLHVAFREVPANWNIGEIRLFVMCGKEPNTTSSLCPISLLSIAEFVERLIHEHLSHFLESNHLLLHPASAGFSRNRSTEVQVAAVTQFIHDGIQQRRPHLRTDLLLPDFCRG